MAKVSNEQLRVMLDHDLATMRCRRDCGHFILEVCTNEHWHKLKSKRGHVREFKSFDAMVNHVSRLTAKPFNIEFVRGDA